MALLDEKTREKYLKELGYKTVKDFQKDVMYPQWVDGVYGTQTDNALRTAYNVHKYCKSFKPKEFMCECGGKYCGGYPDYMKPSELKHIQTIRDHYGKPITITSGLRCKEWNRVLNGSVENSGHLRGLALDFYQAGVTDTVANRKAAMRYFMSLPNHKFTYGASMNGSDGIYRSAAYMGNAMHTECTNTDVPVGKLNVDGIGGSATVMAIQKYFKVKVVDGIISGQNSALGKYYPSLIAVEYGVGGSATVKALQKWAGATADGVWGKGTSEAMQKKLNSLGYSVGSYGADGVFGTGSMKALQRFLNGDKPTPVPPTPTDYYKMIDVSEFQSSIDWAKVKADGVKGVIVRCGFRGYEKGTLQQDPKFMTYIKGAHAVGIPVGIYMFTQAINEKEGKEEADYAVNLWKKSGVPISYPIAIDTEHVSANARANNLTRAQRTSAIKGFCERIKKLGYTPMIYASTSWLNNDLDMSKLPYDVWCAQYYSECQYKGKYIIWQYTSEGRVNGVSGVVDMNRCYIKPKTVNPPKPSPSGKPYTGAYPIIDRRKLIVDMAVKLAWAKGTPTKTYTFPNGRATKAFQNALDTAYPEHNKWGAAARVGASCDVFLGTVVRAVQIDSKFPRGLEQQFDYAPKWADRFVYKGIAPANKSQDGDIVLFSYDGSGHAIIRGNGMYYEANHPTYFGHTNPSLARLRRKQNDTIVLRPKNYLAKGDTGAEVKKLQKYLNWYGNYKLATDGIFGDGTRKALVDFQKKEKIAADGLCGAGTVAKMKEVRK